MIWEVGMKAVCIAKPGPWFAGTSFDAFDGYLKEVDLRGHLWRGKLVLAGGKREIDCSFRGFTIEQIRAYLDHRVWAEGLAIYTEESGLPARLEINRIRPIDEDRDLSRWRGALKESEWGGDILDDFEQQ